MSFWKTKTLAEMTDEEWESLCDGCGKCCLHKLEDEDTGEVYYTNVACRLLNLKTCRCTNYPNRTRLVPECIDLKQHNIAEFSWMPSTCAYRLIVEGKELPRWHPLISGNTASVVNAGVSIKRYAIPESDAGDMEDHVIERLG
jgi:uncharacterized cysteine cluster protein YcgN (CxxCxxCC family)